MLHGQPYAANLYRLNYSLQKVGAPWSLAAKNSVSLDQNEVMALFCWPCCLPVREWADGFLKLSALNCCPFRESTSGHRGLESKGFAGRIPKAFVSSCTLGTMNLSYVIVTCSYVFISNFATLGYCIFLCLSYMPWTAKSMISISCITLLEAGTMFSIKQGLSNYW